MVFIDSGKELDRIEITKVEDYFSYKEQFELIFDNLINSK